MGILVRDLRFVKNVNHAQVPRNNGPGESQDHFLMTGLGLPRI